MKTTLVFLCAIALVFGAPVEENNEVKDLGHEDVKELRHEDSVRFDLNPEVPRYYNYNYLYHPARAYLDPAYYPPIRTYTDALGRSYQVHYLPNGQIYRIPLATRDLPPAVIASLLG